MILGWWLWGHSCITKLLKNLYSVIIAVIRYFGEDMVV